MLAVKITNNKEYLSYYSNTCAIATPYEGIHLTFNKIFF